MATEDNIQQGTWRGVPFDVRSSDGKGGRFLVVHEFPNSGKRSIEDLGEDLPSFTFNAFVHGDDNHKKRDALIVALTKGGIGKLVHPFEGTFEGHTGKFSHSESMTALGETRFTIQFKASEPAQLAKTSGSSEEGVVDKNAGVKNECEKSIADGFRAKNSNDNAQTYSDKIKNVAGFGKSKSNDFGFLEGSEEEQNTLAKLINDLNDNSAALVSQGEILAKDVTDLIRQVIVEGRSSIDSLNTALEFFTFGDGDVLKIANTFARKEVARNFGLINGAIRAQSISEAYKGIVLSDFATVEDITEVLQVVEKEFFKLEKSIIISLPKEVLGDEIDQALGAALEANTSSFFSIITDDVLAVVKSVRDEANLIIKDKIPNLASVLEQDLGNSSEPLSVLTFRFYGDLDNRDKILGLNQAQNPSYLTGNVNIIS